MNRYLMALCWAAATILVAAGGHFGLIEQATARTLVWLLPVLALVTMQGRQRCAVGKHP